MIVIPACRTLTSLIFTLWYCHSKISESSVHHWFYYSSRLLSTTSFSFHCFHSPTSRKSVLSHNVCAPKDRLYHDAIVSRYWYFYHFVYVDEELLTASAAHRCGFWERSPERQMCVWMCVWGSCSPKISLITHKLQYFRTKSPISLKLAVTGCDLCNQRRIWMWWVRSTRSWDKKKSAETLRCFFVYHPDRKRLEWIK